MGRARSRVWTRQLQTTRRQSILDATRATRRLCLLLLHDDAALQPLHAPHAPDGGCRAGGRRRRQGHGPGSVRHFLLPQGRPRRSASAGITLRRSGGDVVKTRIQLDPVKYNQGFIGGFKQVIEGEGAGALLTGLGPTAQGYFIQGWFKFGGVEYFKINLTQSMGEQAAWNSKTSIYLLASACAEFIADIFLCPCVPPPDAPTRSPMRARPLPPPLFRVPRHKH